MLALSLLFVSNFISGMNYFIEKCKKGNCFVVESKMSTTCPYTQTNSLLKQKIYSSHNVTVSADVGVRRLDQYGELRV
jgi:hypothetical protein